ncbi:MAG: DNA gyrase inhibitor YacG [Betaproteobacteria bacterium]|nr:DNA gyrase inhibitor YacG [Betaproteobacteria bacterium]
MSESGSEKRLVRCPRCGKESEWSGENPHRPFCSARCKQIDLGAWASEEYRVPCSPQDGESEASNGVLSG